jgi:hypothetical protein
VVRIPKMSLMMILCRGDLSGRGASAGQTSIDRTLGAARSNSPTSHHSDHLSQAVDAVSCAQE